MKTMNFRFFRQVLMASVILSIAVISCKKDDDDDPVDPPKETQASLEFHFHPVVGNTAYQPNQDYTMQIGDTTITYSFNENSAFYISGIHLETTEGAEAEFHDTYLLVKPETDEYGIGKMKAASYESISFNVGVDSATNHKDPALHPAGHPLALQNPSMHWSWNPGYRFMVLEGSWSASTGESGTFLFHLGLDEFLTHVHLHFHHPLQAKAGQSVTAHMNVDYGKLLEGINLKRENYTKSMSQAEKPLAQKLANNIPNAFILE